MLRDDRVNILLNIFMEKPEDIGKTDKERLALRKLDILNKQYKHKKNFKRRI